MKKTASLLLAFFMLLTLFAGCASEEGAGGTPAPAGDASQTEGPTDAGELDVTFDEDPVELNIIFWHGNQIPSDLDMVSEAISEITLEKINATVNLTIMDAGTYLQQAPLMVSSGEKVDLMITFAAAAPHFSNMVAQGQLLPLNDLLEEYATEALAQMPNDVFLEATTVNGNIYALPTVSNKVNDLYWYCRTAELTELGYSAEDVTTLEDVAEVMYAAKEAYPQRTILSGAAKTTNLMYAGMDPLNMIYYDTLGENSAFPAVVQYTPEGDTSYEVVSYYELDTVNAAYDLLRTWYNDGLIDKDLTTRDTAIEPLLDANVFSAFLAGNITRIGSISGTVGEEITTVLMQTGPVATAQLLQMTWALPVSCEEPEAAARMMNLIYTDPDIANLMSFGIEGVHYEFRDNGTIGFLEGQDATSSGYFILADYYIGNQFITHVWDDSEPDAKVRGQQVMEDAVYSPLIGFSLDTSPLQDIFTVLSPMLVDEYKPQLTCGASTEATIEELSTKLHAAGVDEYIAEAQRQLDEWLENK